MRGVTMGVAGLVAMAVISHADDLSDAIRDTDLAFTNTSREAYLVVFDAVESELVESWPVTVRSIARGDWILVYATLVDGEAGEPFPPGVLRRALAYNASTAGSKLSLDAEGGNLDVQYEIPIEALTGSMLGRIVNDVAITCDREHDGYARQIEAERRP